MLSPIFFFLPASVHVFVRPFRSPDKLRARLLPEQHSGPDMPAACGAAPNGAAPAPPSGTLTFARAVVVPASAGAPTQNLGGAPRRFPRQRHRVCAGLTRLACEPVKLRRGQANMKQIAKLINLGFERFNDYEDDSANFISRGGLRDGRQLPGRAFAELPSAI